MILEFYKGFSFNEAGSHGEECGIRTFQREIFVVISVTRVPLFVLNRDKIAPDRISGWCSSLLSAIIPDRKLILVTVQNLSESFPFKMCPI